MATLEITNNDTRSLVVWDPVFDDDTIIDAGGETYPAGTLLGRLTASSKLTKYESGNSDGSEIPVAVLRDEIVLAAATDTAVRPIIGGRVRRGDLLHAGSPITQLEADALRDFGIVPLTTTQIAELDNQ